MSPDQIRFKSFKNPVYVVTKQNGIEISSSYFLFGQQVKLHEFKRRCKHLSHIEIVVINEDHL